MGGLFSISMPCDQVVNQVSQCLGTHGSYIYSLSENLAALQRDIEVLKAKRDDVQRRVCREEFTGRRERLSLVQVWLTNVLNTENKFNDLLRTYNIELQRLCLCGFCSKNVRLSYLYGKRIVMMLNEVERLSSQGVFTDVTEEIPVAKVDEMPVQATIVGQETMLEKVWTHLMEEGVEILGMYGMGGVGKTTLLTQLNNKFSETCRGGGFFEVVIWVVVSKTPEIHRIQGDIAKKLGLGGEEWDQKNENQRALEIHRVLKRRKFVLLLDDIWEKVCVAACCFLYCSLFPEDYRREKERLIDYWMCEGFLDENQTRERVLSQGYEIISILVRACLLLEEAVNKEQVKMHDVVREMALWIASDLGKDKEQCIVQARSGLCEIPRIKNWSGVTRMSLMENEIEIVSGSTECSKLTTLFLQKNASLIHISSDFFQCIPMLVVLDLSGNSSLRKLPEQISELVSLRYLDMSKMSLDMSLMEELPQQYKGLAVVV
ncbi:unnamed protein product [Eruca vesicaria subsp. sativa]|uniref:NB-ARC domain-containing protein n=1 Tax=Eruca vesicaria subsp. sativa TaxID=29727 RepID=A0ABC8LY98_ERUVS|nr:unnamed protein product [Eruca vesicaria subsp. sativa]